MKMHIRQTRYGKWFSLLACSALCAGGILSAGGFVGAASAVEVQWDFDNAALTPNYNDHTTTMGYRNDATTSAVVTFGTASGFALPAMPGGNATAMQFPAFTAAQGFGLYDLGPANGGGAFINQYTMAWDVLFPSANAWQSLFQTSATNGNDGDFFVRPSGSGGGVGISSNYHGTIGDNTWHRIVAVVDQTVPSMAKYIDGVLVGTTALSGVVDGRWAMHPDGSANVPPAADAFILADEDGDTNLGYISTFYYTDKLVSAETILGWGGADADGIKAVPEPSTYLLALLGVVGALACRRFRRS